MTKPELIDKIDEILGDPFKYRRKECGSIYLGQRDAILSVIADERSEACSEFSAHITANGGSISKKICGNCHYYV